MDDSEAAVGLLVQLGSAAGMMLVLTLVHAVGLALLTRVPGLDRDRLENDYLLHLPGIMLSCTIAVGLFLLHMLEIFLFAIFYLAVGAMQGLEEALYYSASAYATLGRTADYFPPDWRLMGAIEALIGFLLIGWSTAFIVKTIDKLRR